MTKPYSYYAKYSFTALFYLDAQELKNVAELTSTLLPLLS